MKILKHLLVRRKDEFLNKEIYRMNFRTYTNLQNISSSMANKCKLKDTDFQA
jgi:hypothetical protein